MTYTTIRRGPMGGDHYTQIHNGVFRDATLTPNSKAVLGWISTHQQHWNTSIAGIAKAVGIGQAAAKKAVQLLKQRHYLVYGQERRPDGTKGQAWYYLTDLPAQLAEIGITDEDTVAATVARSLARWQTENRRSEPGGQIHAPGDDDREGVGDAIVFPQVGTGSTETVPPVEPLAVPGRTKKTKEPQENHLDQKIKEPSSSLCDDEYSPQQAAAADMIPMAYPDTDLEDLEDWITGRVEGGLEGCEWNAAQAMFERGEPPEKVANTILRQRRRGYAA
jgi:hypothetical protein